MPRFAFHRAEIRRPRKIAGPSPAAVQDLFDVAVAPTSHPEATPASHEAADQAYLTSYPNALRALRLLSTAGPMTSNRCAELLGLDDQAIRPRFTQMKKREWLVALKERQPTGHGGKAHVHAITEDGRTMLRLLTPDQESAA